MKVCRSQSVPKKGQSQVPRNAAVPAAQGVDPFDALDMFLTGLILDRAPVGDRTGLTDWLAEADRKAAKGHGRKKSAFASAS